MVNALVEPAEVLLEKTPGILALESQMGL